MCFNLTISFSKGQTYIGYIFAYIWICLLLDLNTVMKLVFALVLQEVDEGSTWNLEVQVISSPVHHRQAPSECQWFIEANWITSEYRRTVVWGCADTTRYLHLVRLTWGERPAWMHFWCPSDAGALPAQGQTELHNPKFNSIFLSDSF